MNDRDAVAWLHRRVGFGLPPDLLRAAVARGPLAELDRLLDPAGLGAPPADDPWDDSLLPYDPRDRQSRKYAVAQWVHTMTVTEQPLVDRMAWLWHGHFVSAIDKVRVARLMVDQIRLFRSLGLGAFDALVRAVTIDPAMLVYLDLRTSTGRAPNENYARELMELFTLGEGAYTEADVKAGALALTGWTLRKEGDVRFAPRLHDDSPQHYLGSDGVHDLDGVIAALTAHPQLPRFVANLFAEEFLGTAPFDVIDRLAAAFADADFDVRSLVRAVVLEGLNGASAPVVLAPVPWLVGAVRVTGSAAALRDTVGLLQEAGQLPMLPPNVAGWPGGTAWFAASSLVARLNLASVVADATPAGEVLAAAEHDDVSVLADALGLPSTGFAGPSADALRSAPAGRDRLAIALATPEFLIA